MKRHGHYWLKMAKHIAKLQKAFLQCHDSFDVEESLFVEEATNRKKLYLNFLLHKVMALSSYDFVNVKIKS